MYLHLSPNLLHFLPDLGALYNYAMRPTFMKSTPEFEAFHYHKCIRSWNYSRVCYLKVFKNSLKNFVSALFSQHQTFFSVFLLLQIYALKSACILFLKCFLNFLSDEIFLCCICNICLKQVLFSNKKILVECLWTKIFNKMWI
jgi:hypothetical protein